MSARRLAEFDELFECLAELAGSDAGRDEGLQMPGKRAPLGGHRLIERLTAVDRRGDSIERRREARVGQLGCGRAEAGCQRQARLAQVGHAAGQLRRLALRKRLDVL